MSGIRRRILEAGRFAGEHPKCISFTSQTSSAGRTPLSNTTCGIGEGAVPGASVDGHGNDAGYLTRCEAYLDSKGCCDARTPSRKFADDSALASALRKKIYVPRMVERHRTGPGGRAARRLGLSMRKSRLPRMTNTRILGRKFSSGDECYPLNVTLGDFLQITEQPGFDPKKTAFFMVTGHGPCRFGQYAPYLKSVLTQIGYPEVTICQPSTEKGYSDSESLRRCYAGRVARDCCGRYFVETPPEVTARMKLRRARRRRFRGEPSGLCKVLEVTYASFDKRWRRFAVPSGRRAKDSANCQCI